MFLLVGPGCCFRFAKLYVFFGDRVKSVRIEKSDIFLAGPGCGVRFAELDVFFGGGEAFALKSRMFFWRGRFAAFVCKVGWVFFGWEAGLGRWPKQISSNKSYQSSGPWKWTCQLVRNYRVVKINSPIPPLSPSHFKCLRFYVQGGYKYKRATDKEQV